MVWCLQAASPWDRQGEEGHLIGRTRGTRLTLKTPFAVGKFHLTVDQFSAFVAETGYNAESECYRLKTDGKWDQQHQGRSWRNPGFAQTGSHPAVCLSWNDVSAYVAWLVRKTGKNYRLLTEAEREYATRAGTTTTFWWGPSISTRQANYNGTTAYGGGPTGEDRQKTVAVELFQPNPWGLYQVHGNVWEWVEDCWHDSYAGAPSNGSAWISGNCSMRTFRGGSWNFVPGALRSAARGFSNPALRLVDVGLRLGRTLAP